MVLCHFPFSRTYLHKHKHIPISSEHKRTVSKQIAKSHRRRSHLQLSKPIRTQRAGLRTLQPHQGQLGHTGTIFFGNSNCFQVSIHFLVLEDWKPLFTTPETAEFLADLADNAVCEWGATSTQIVAQVMSFVRKWNILIGLIGSFASLYVL